MINWQQPQRQSLAALAIMGIRFIKAIFRSVWPILLITIFKGNEKVGLKLLIFVAIIIVLAVAAAILGFINFKFYIVDNKLIILKGIFKKEVITIPLEKIQTIHLEQSLLHTITGTFKVLIDTAGTEKVESSIYALDTATSASLKELILGHQGTQTIEAANVATKKTLIKTDAADLLKLCLTANHIETLAIVCVFVFSRLEDMKPLLNNISFGWLEKYEEQMELTWKLVLAMVVLVAIFSILISSVRTLLRYANFNVEVSNKGFHIRGGLIQMKQMVIPFSKVQLLNWNANLLKRFTGMYVLHLKATGEGDLKKKQKVLFPITKQEQLQEIIPYYEAALPAANSETNGIHQAFIWRRVLFIGIPIAAVFTTVSYLILGYAGLWALLWLVYFTINNVVYKNNFRFWVNIEALQVATGVWGRQQTLIKWNNVQLVRLRQSPYQRSNQLATVIFFTAAGKVQLPYLPLQDATFLVDYAAMKIESSTTNWM